MVFSTFIVISPSKIIIFRALDSFLRQSVQLRLGINRVFLGGNRILLIFVLEKSNQARQVGKSAPFAGSGVFQRRPPCAPLALPPQPQEIRMIDRRFIFRFSVQGYLSLEAIHNSIMGSCRSQNVPKTGLEIIWIPV